MRGLKRLIIFLVLLIIAYGVWWFVDDQYRSDLAKVRYDTYGREHFGELEKERVKPEDIERGNEGNRPVKTELVFLLAGVDAGTSEAGTRTDTLILCKVNWLDNKISMLSIPRDSYVYIRGEADKVNHAHSYGGMQLTMETLRSALGIDLDYYFTMDFDAVMELVDIIGGVEVDVQEPQASDLKLDVGVQKLDGYMAMEYVRYRKGFESGDLGRVSAQQDFLRIALPQILSPKNIVHLPALLSALNDYSDSNFGPLTTLSMMPAALRFGSAEIESAVLPGYPGERDAISYYFLYPDEVQWLMDEYLSAYQTGSVDVPE